MYLSKLYALVIPDYNVIMFILQVFTSLLLGVVFMCVVYLWFVHRKYDHIRGPVRESFFAGNLGGVKKEIENGGFFQNYLLKCIKRYGKTIRISLFSTTMVVTCDLNAIRSLLVTGHHPKSKMISDGTTTLFGARFLGNSFVMETDHEKWARKRNLLNPCFQKSYLRDLISDFNLVSDSLVTRLQEIADGSTKVEMLEEFNKLTLDALSKIAFGIDVNSLHEKDNQFTNAIFLVMKGFSMKNRNPLITFNPMSWRFIWKVRQACNLLRIFGNQLISDRQQSMKAGLYVPNDILTHIVKIKESNPDLDHEEILDDFVAFFIAGQETVASVLSFMLLEILKNSEIHQRLLNEIDEGVGEKTVLDYSDLMNLPYLDMVMKETLRLYPPAASTFREVQTDCNIGGFSVPAKTTVCISTYVCSRLEEYFTDPEKFDPERFSPEAKHKVNIYTYFPFTLGPRTCLGKHFAEIEAKIVMVKLLQRFKFDLCPTQSLDIEEVLILRPKGKTVCTVKSREN